MLGANLHFFLFQAAAASANRSHSSLPNLSKIKLKSKDPDKKYRKRWRIGEARKQEKLAYVIDKDDEIPIEKLSINDLTLMQLLALVRYFLFSKYSHDFN